MKLYPFQKQAIRNAKKLFQSGKTNLVVFPFQTGGVGKQIKTYGKQHKIKYWFEQVIG